MSYKNYGTHIFALLLVSPVLPVPRSPVRTGASTPLALSNGLTLSLLAALLVDGGRRSTVLLLLESHGQLMTAAPVS